MTHQEAYDKIKERAKDTRKAGSFTEGWCYRAGETGLACFVGCLIPDDAYHAGLEGRGVGDIRGEVEALTDLDLRFLKEVQNIHDCWPVYEWAPRLYEIAIKFGLNP